MIINTSVQVMSGSYFTPSFYSVRECLLPSLNGKKLISYDGYERQINYSDFAPRNILHYSYDDVIKATDEENAETFELEWIANNI